ncbi:MAG: CotH kinase family protein [Paludibacteraceae bacterium]|nr:CotH kinase family protein [Paludibacteraceae bacterium]
MRKTIIQLSIIVSILSFYHSVHAQSLLINEVMHSNIDGIMDDLNEFPDSWVEIYNNTDDSISADGLKIGTSEDPLSAYTICDRVQIKPHDYYIIYCDKKAINKHTHFRIDCNDDTHLYLFDKTNELIDEQLIPAMLAPNITYGKSMGQSTEWGYLLKSTPGSSNDSIISDILLENPIFSHEGGLYTQPFTLTLSNALNPNESTIHFTTNGSEPTIDSPIFPDSIIIDKTTIIRAKVFSSDYHSPLSTTHSYIFTDREITLPYISIVTDSLYLYDDEIGIYAEGTYGISHPEAESQLPDDFGRYNYTFNWRRPSNVEYYDTPNKQGTVVNQMCELRIGGNTSRQYPIKSLVLYANQRFGKKRFSYSFWNAKKDISKFKSLYLRNAGGDFLPLCYIRDAYAQLSVGSHVDLDWSAYQPTIIYINGTYKGIINLREYSKEDIVWSNHNKLENIDFIQNWQYPEVGDLNDFNYFLRVVNNESTTFNDLFNLMDINEFLNYYVLNTFFSNKDFPANNNLAWKEKSASGKWRWIAKDMDQSIGMSVFNTQLNEYDYPSLNYNTRTGDFEETGNNIEIYCSIFNKILSFNQSRNQFIDKASIYTGTFLSASANTHRLDSLLSNIDNEMNYFTPLYNFFPNDWRYWCNDMKEWLQKRNDFFYHHLQDFFSLGDTTSLVIESHKSKQLYFNDIKVENNRFNGKYYEKRHLYLSHEPNLFSYDADTFTASIDTVPTFSYWVVRYQLNDSIVHNTFHTNNLLYHIPQDAQNVHISDTLFVTWDTLPTITHVIDKPLCSISVNELISSPWAHDQLGNHYKGFLIDTLLSIGTNTIDWNVVSIIGDTLHYPQTIVLIDSFAPEIDCQQLTTIELSITTNQCVIDNAEVSFPIPTATDNCDIIIDGTLSAPNEYYLGNNTIYWTFTDSAGNTTQCSQNIMVVDRFAPYYDCQKLPDLSFDLNTINCSIDSSEIQLTSPIATDNCETAIVGTLSAPKEYLVGNNMIYWTFTDSAGNTSQCPQNIIVLDKVAPVVNCDYIVPLTYNIFTSDCGINSQLLNIQTPYAIDNCGSIVEGYADIPDSFEIGDHTIDWHFTDIYGNESLCTQSITIADYYAPVVQPEAENILYITLPLNANDIASDEVKLPTLFATDNCNELIEGNVTLPTNFSIGDNILLWTFSDDYGNISYFPQNVYAIKQFELMIYPNPVDETLYISGVEPDEEIILYNMFGQRIYQTKSIGNPATIDMSQFTDNLYFILFRNQYYKIIKK